jgi:hypothetical protein
MTYARNNKRRKRKAARKMATWMPRWVQWIPIGGESIPWLTLAVEHDQESRT